MVWVSDEGDFNIRSAVKVELFIGSWVDCGAINYNEGKKEEVETGFSGKTMKSVLGPFNH